MSDILDDPSNGQITNEYVDRADWPRPRREGDLRAYGREYEGQLALGARLEEADGLRHALPALADEAAPIEVPRVNATTWIRRGAP
jgi:hypothetical protein